MSSCLDFWFLKHVIAGCGFLERLGGRKRSILRLYKAQESWRVMTINANTLNMIQYMYLNIYPANLKLIKIQQHLSCIWQRLCLIRIHFFALLKFCLFCWAWFVNTYAAMQPLYMVRRKAIMLIACVYDTHLRSGGEHQSQAASFCFHAFFAYRVEKQKKNKRHNTADRRTSLI